MPARARVIIDNDFAGDPDGLFQLAHHVLCTSVEVVQVIASRVPDAMVAPGQDFIADGVAAANEVLELACSPLRAVPGSPTALGHDETPRSSPTVETLIREAMRDDTGAPLYFAAGAGLTALAMAYSIEPRIAKRLTLVWIGGNGYEHEAPGLEFNTSSDLLAAQIVFQSPIPIWQVPESTYGQCLVSWAELDRDIAPLGALGSHLVERWRSFNHFVEGRFGASLGECAVLGDSPLVLLTALQGTFHQDPSSSPSQLLPRRPILDSGAYGAPTDGLPPVRVFTAVDMRLMYGDLVAKLAARHVTLRQPADSTH